MKFLITAWYEFLKNIRDVKMIAFLILFPLAVTYLLGLAGQSFFKPEEKSAIKAAYVNMDGGAAGQAFGQFLAGKDIGGMLEAIPYTTLDEGKGALSGGDCTVLIFLPEDLTEATARGESRKIELYGNEEVEFVKTLVSGFTSSLNASIAVAETGGVTAQIERASVVKRVNITRDGEYPNLSEYYAVLVLLQALVIGAIFGVYISTRKYGSDIHIRMHVLPANPWSLLIGRITGSAAYLMLASVATILFTGYAYGVNWNGNLPVLLATLMLFCLIMVGIGVLCGRVFRKTSSAIMMVFALMFLFGTLSGSSSPRSSVVSLGFLTPNYYAKMLLFGSIYGYPDQAMATAALCLMGIAATVFIAIVFLMRRVRYDNF